MSACCNRREPSTDGRGDRRASAGGAATPLWASAFVLAGMLVMSAGRIAPQAGAGSPAAVAAGGMQVMTLTNGDGSSTQFNESVYVLDNFSETLFVYTIENATDKRGLILRTAEPLQQVFRNARPRQ
jgi:hypothetical protein